MGRLDRPLQRQAFPHVDVSVERAGVRDVIFSRRHTQDGLQVARLPKDPALRRQRVATERPELPGQTEPLVLTAGPLRERHRILKVLLLNHFKSRIHNISAITSLLVR